MTPDGKKDKEMKDDWDAVSSAADEDAVWDAVSTPAAPEPTDSTPRQSSQPDTPTAKQITMNAPPRPPSHNASVMRGHVSAFFLIRSGLVITVIALLVAGGVLFSSHKVAVFSSGTAPVTATANDGSTTLAQGNDTATAQAATTATAAQQIYDQATSGAPVFSDPLTDDTNNWGVLSTKWGGSCAFTDGAYHLALSQPHYWIWCVCASTGNLNNFAFQVQVNIAQGNDGGIVFQVAANDYYKAYVSTGTSSQGLPGGLYLLYRQEPSGYHTLEYGFNPAIQTGLNQANVVTVIVENGSLYFYDNGQFLISGSVDAFSNGSTGVSAQSDNLATDVVFSNLKIWTL